jgi:hypothetical protein
VAGRRKKSKKEKVKSKKGREFGKLNAILPASYADLLTDLKSRIAPRRIEGPSMLSKTW